jgi:hypothetical protein
MRPAVAALVVVLGLGTAGCSGSSPPKRAAAPPTTVAPIITLAVTGTDVIWAGKPAAFPGAVKAGVVDTLDKWLTGAVLTPLNSGAAGDITGLFSPDVAPRLSGPDRVALVDEGLPRATGITAAAQTVRLAALTDADGAVALVTATLDVRLDVAALDGPYSVAHLGELVLQQDGGTWRIAGYDVRSVHVDKAGVTNATATTTVTTKVAGK